MLINILTFLVILILTFVNGLTDATNAISTLVGTKVMSFRKACMLSSFFDILGVIVMYYINSSVADCISEIALLPNNISGLTALACGMISAILFSTIACFLGIPTSESHGLVAGITGAALAIGGINNINISKWGNVILGLTWSIVGSIIITRVVYMCISKSLAKINVNKIRKAQILACSGMSFAHGAQDGLKFIGIFYMYTRLVTNNVMIQNDFLIVIICALAMGLGVLIGGKRIVTTVGENMVKLNNEDALCSDFSTAITLVLANLFGIPVSTTHVKTIAVTSIPNNKSSLNKDKFIEIVLAWGLTFPICGVLAFLIMRCIM